MPLISATPSTIASAVSAARSLRPRETLERDRDHAERLLITSSTSLGASRRSARGRSARRRGTGGGRRSRRRAASWVTITIVWPKSSTALRISSSISPPAFESRLPVGSSANTTAGRETSARAIATRCCWPPESSAGRWLRRVCEARPSSISSVEPPAVGLAPGDRERQQDVLLGASSTGSRLKNWKMKPMCSRRSCVSSPSSSVVELGAGDRDRARGRLVEPGEHVHQRRLARARRAHHGDELARRTSTLDAAQGVDRGLALAIAARQLAGRHGDAGWRRRSCALRCSPSIPSYPIYPTYRDARTRHVASSARCTRRPRKSS